MNITQKLCPESLYDIKCPYLMNATRIVIHNTANDASAKNEINYMLSNRKETSYHFAVDDTEIIQAIPLNRNAWHAGDGGSGKGNREGIGIEICYSKSGGERFLKAVDNSAELAAKLLTERNWGIDKVTKHQDYSGKHCPHRILDEYGWKNYLNLIKSKMQQKTQTTEKTEEEEVRFNKFKDLPSWAKTDIKELIDKGYLTGKGGSGDERIIDLSEDAVRTLMVTKKMLEGK